MFEKSYYEQLQDYIESGCKYQLSEEEQDYYNALFDVVGITRKYGKDRAISMLMHEPFNCSRPRAREMYYEAVNLFYLDDTIEPAAHRNMIFDNLMKAAQTVLLSSSGAKDMEIYGNLLTQAWKVKQLDKPDKVKRQEIKEKDIKVYTLDSNLIGVPSIDRKDLANQIDKIPDLPEKERTRLKRDAMAVDINFEEIIDDTQEKTENYRG